MRRLIDVFLFILYLLLVMCVHFEGHLSLDQKNSARRGVLHVQPLYTAHIRTVNNLHLHRYQVEMWRMTVKGSESK